MDKAILGSQRSGIFMDGIRVLTSGFRPNRGSQAPDFGPGLRRVESIPARLPSNTPEQPEIKPARTPITRKEPDNFPPMHFGRSPARATFFGIPIPFNISLPFRIPFPFSISLPFSLPIPFFKSSTTVGSELKFDFLEKKPIRFRDTETAVMGTYPDLMDIVREHAPYYDHLPEHQRWEAMNEALGSHPKYLAARLQHLNAMSRIPTVATATRTMSPGEQTFLTNAFQRISEDVRNKPFHIHGESAVVGNSKGEITNFQHEPGHGIDITLDPGDKYNLHTHPPFGEPATSAASQADHKIAADFYIWDKALSYVTNGKDVLHIQPDSTELVKLIPDPKMEGKLGKFPVAFTVPKPARPPYPFSNHEAPGAL
ncbi:MAG TPA: hypothetical protein VK465_13720 [Fibrobacteria bacterium]|nr:hypothetical protein [Fibrobacteria bacterium]